MITIKDLRKAFGLSFVVLCAVYLGALFESFRLDQLELDPSAFDELAKALYEAQLAQAKMMNIIALGVIGAFAVVTLVFSVSKYVDDNRANMGILKAIGYTDFQISVKFVLFGLNALVGGLVGYLACLATVPAFYAEMNEGSGYPAVTFSFRLSVPLFYVVVPAVAFSLLGVLFAYRKLKRSPLDLIRGTERQGKTKKMKEGKTFLSTLRKTVLFRHGSLILFVGFAALCFGGTVQMSFSMDGFGVSPMFFWMMFLIAILLGVSVLYLAFSFLFQANKEYVSLLKAFGYSDAECVKALFGGYVSVSVIGFAVGTVYQIGIIYLIIELFKDVAELTYTFSVNGFFIALGLFVFTFAVIALYFFKKLKLLTLKKAW
ncbi:MAG: FtsX-like permease family protein [Clostridia bacterium]|nr:FtsX-like permease family protein [Clostridia bacterium]